MSDCNDIRWKLDSIEKRQRRMESRQTGIREQNLINLLKIASANDVVRVALGVDWVHKVYLHTEQS
jgi:hypothetical protein